MNKYYKLFFRYHDRYEEILLQLIRWRDFINLKNESTILLFEVKLIDRKQDDLVDIYEETANWGWKGNSYQKHLLSISAEEIESGLIFEAEDDDSAKLIFEVSECMS